MIDDSESLWNSDCSDHPNLRLSDGIGSEYTGRSSATAVGSHGISSSVWGRIGNSGNQVEATGKCDSTIASMSYLGNETKDNVMEGIPSVSSKLHQKKWTVVDGAGPKAKNHVATTRLQSDPARNNGRTSQKALRTLFVSGIPLSNNKRESLLSHFKIFGEVIDIYIPLNSERAFVQFSTREEAESALKAPDAVMGNRFIKLWWANRDSIPDEGLSSGATESSALRGITATSSLLQSPVVASGGKGNLPSFPSMASSIPSDTSMPTAVHSKLVVANVPKEKPSQKKLELLKEEIRLKQEMLDQKRNNFRRQLDRLEKKAGAVKDETTAQQDLRRHKGEMVTEVAKSTIPGSTSKSGVRREVKKMQDKNNPVENVASLSSKINSTTVLQSPRTLKTPNHLSAPVGTPNLVNRFKLDNRPTAFRILPPVPMDLLNVAVLKEHFSTFGDLSTVDLEGAEAQTVTAHSELSKMCSPRITFTTRRSAEKAFLNGKCCQGHSLHFAWLITSSTPSNNSMGQNSPNPTAKALPDAETLTKSVTTGSSTSDTGKSTCSISQPANITGNGDTSNSEGALGDIKPTGFVEASSSRPMPMALHEIQSPKAHIFANEDDLNDKLAR